VDRAPEDEDIDEGGPGDGDPASGAADNEGADEATATASRVETGVDCESAVVVASKGAED
jgi:hypothetical protein